MVVGGLSLWWTFVGLSVCFADMVVLVEGLVWWCAYVGVAFVFRVLV